jgi:DEAD/DEAH box helicase domain-containing protein
MCDPRDLGSVAELRSSSTQQPTVTVYEVYPGGVGYAARLFELHRQLLEDAVDLVASCPCAAGCPSCIGPINLPRNVDPEVEEEAKNACLRLLDLGLSNASAPEWTHAVPA